MQQILGTLAADIRTGADAKKSERRSEFWVSKSARARSGEFATLSKRFLRSTLGIDMASIGKITARSIICQQGSFSEKTRNASPCSGTSPVCRG